ncbi:tRNA-splicing endonuclease subunit Sen54-like isoform X2 [Pecten maximus]|uniref:tRNA-splicing endonuclease subunit Sen54-like isoform X1 n=1 Tax=Pecten maximus TaxID=6579 RepID=UPI001458929B|nr:tRNA-splicing endonuclease subunit Sen54-like isoform X1 [Pecten maximus]XP_033741069.1 tRNA-splicing endonuclease subunit Sen54-like isoform X2 [Pecten maximus]
MDETACKVQDPDAVLLKEGILSAEELFKYRRPLDKSVPNRGGAKDFEPDGSFLQSKWIESLSQERSKVLREQRVEREGGLVKGDWNKDLQLVELEREMGKFWTYMGFVDSSRKWLFPEEALFLMETNTLVVNYKGLPLSIQQAYAAFLGTVSMTTECYQVYAHLRRLGYVVLRHQGCLDITTYERKIHLDQHVKTDKKKRKHKGDKTSNIPGLGKDHKKVKVTSEDSDQEMLKEQLECVHPDKCVSQMEVDRPATAEVVIDDRPHDKDVSNTSAMDDLPDTGDSELTEESDPLSVPYSVWEFDKLGFPDIGGVEVLELQMPRLDLLPHGVDLSNASTTFDVRAYFSQQRKHHKKHRRQQRQESVENLEFSYSEMIHKKKKITASNWGEFKRKMAIRDLEDERMLVSPAECLWEGEITPLVKPSDATSTGSILNKLHIIESVNLPMKPRYQDTPVTLPGGTVFDVYLPDAKFRKSRPGVPNYRVCVSKIHESPPSLQQIVSTQGSFPDGVPVSWAVLDHGDIAFYQFSDICLPQEVSMG